MPELPDFRAEPSVTPEGDAKAVARYTAWAEANLDPITSPEPPEEKYGWDRLAEVDRDLMAARVIKESELISFWLALHRAGGFAQQKQRHRAVGIAQRQVQQRVEPGAGGRFLDRDGEKLDRPGGERDDGVARLLVFDELGGLRGSIGLAESGLPFRTGDRQNFSIHPNKIRTPSAPFSC